jgi:threonine/homoserine/homoserine lactone efflux protein
MPIVFFEGVVSFMLAELLTIFFSSFIIAFSGAMMPGPLLTATISESSKRGFLAGPMLIAGHGILEMGLVVLLMLGVVPFFQREEVFAVIAIAGGAILLWMAFGMFRTLPTLSLSLNAEKTDNSSLIVSGILLSLANPYWIIWWATIGFGYILHSRQFAMWGIIFFFTGHILADLVWYSAVAAAVGKGRHLFTDGIYRGIMGTCAVSLVVFACYFFYAGFNKAFL